MARPADIANPAPQYSKVLHNGQAHQAAKWTHAGAPFGPARARQVRKELKSGQYFGTVRRMDDAAISSKREAIAKFDRVSAELGHQKYSPVKSEREIDKEIKFHMDQIGTLKRLKKIVAERRQKELEMNIRARAQKDEEKAKKKMVHKLLKRRAGVCVSGRPRKGARASFTDGGGEQASDILRNSRSSIDDGSDDERAELDFANCLVIVPSTASTAGSGERGAPSRLCECAPPAGGSAMNNGDADTVSVSFPRPM